VKNEKVIREFILEDGFEQERTRTDQRRRYKKRAPPTLTGVRPEGAQCSTFSLS
jgi:hypothetical protein